MKKSRAWVSNCVQGCDWGEGPAIIGETALGYPVEIAANQVLGAMMLRDLEQHFPETKFVCLYDGDGILDFTMDDVRAVRRGVGRIEVDVEFGLGRTATTATLFTTTTATTVFNTTATAITATAGWSGRGVMTLPRTPDQVSTMACC